MLPHDWKKVSQVRGTPIYSVVVGFLTMAVSDLEVVCIAISLTKQAQAQVIKSVETKNKEEKQAEEEKDVEEEDKEIGIRERGGGGE